MSLDDLTLLEDASQAKTIEWLSTQKSLTDSYLKGVDTLEFQKRIHHLLKINSIGVPFQRGEHYFFFAREGDLDHSILYKCSKLLENPEHLLNPNTFSNDGLTSLRGIRLSKNACHIAYGVHRTGSDQSIWRVRQVANSTDLEDQLEGIHRPFVSWTHDNKGFFYTRTSKVVEEGRTLYRGEKVFYHTIGEAQEQDVLVYEDPQQPHQGYVAKVSEDGAYLLVFAYESANDNNRVFVKDLRKPNASFRCLVEKFEGYFVLVASVDASLVFRTNQGAPRGRVIEINAETAEVKEVISESKDILQIVSVAENCLIAVYLRDAHSVVKVFGLDGVFQYEVELPDIGTASGFQSTRQHKEFYFSFTNYYTPHTQFSFNVASKKLTKIHQPDMQINSEDFVTRQVFYHSHDGTKVPMFVSHHKDLKRDGSNPTFLYSYGGFGYSHTPQFLSANYLWMKAGGVYAVANVRGGGEYGEEWHQAGKRENKVNSFNDFIHAAKWLIDNDYSRPDKLGAGGRSNGGLTVASSVLMKPEYFGAAVIAVAVLDLERFHKFTVGSAWIDEYGDPDNDVDLKFLQKHSPLRLVGQGQSYPAMLVVTADHDDRVHPSHSYKFVANLIEKNPECASSTFLHVERNAGHGHGKPVSSYVEEVATQYSFLADQLGLKF